MTRTWGCWQPLYNGNWNGVLVFLVCLQVVLFHRYLLSFPLRSPLAELLTFLSISGPRVLAATRPTRSISCGQRTLVANFKVDSLIEVGIWASCTTTVEEATDCVVGGASTACFFPRGAGTCTDRATVPSVSWLPASQVSCSEENDT